MASESFGADERKIGSGIILNKSNPLKYVIGFSTLAKEKYKIFYINRGILYNKNIYFERICCSNIYCNFYNRIAKILIYCKYEEERL